MSPEDDLWTGLLKFNIFAEVKPLIDNIIIIPIGTNLIFSFFSAKAISLSALTLKTGSGKKASFFKISAVFVSQ